MRCAEDQQAPHLHLACARRAPCDVTGCIRRDRLVGVAPRGGGVGSVSPTDGGTRASRARAPRWRHTQPRTIGRPPHAHTCGAALGVRGVSGMPRVSGRAHGGAGEGGNRWGHAIDSVGARDSYVIGSVAGRERVSGRVLSLVSRPRALYVVAENGVWSVVPIRLLVINSYFGQDARRRVPAAGGPGRATAFARAALRPKSTSPVRGASEPQPSASRNRVASRLSREPERATDL